MRAMWLVVLTGCVLGTKVPPLELRHFEPVDDHVASSDGGHDGPSLRVGRVVADSHLRYRIAHRESPVELLFYETLRWTERPDEYVRRALLRDLVDRHHARLIVGGDAPSLEVEVTAFEELRRGNRSFARVQLRYQLDDERCVVATDVITIERESASRDISDVVVAIGQAMRAATAELAGRMVTVLQRRSTTEPR